jgi:hypothetical protein
MLLLIADAEEILKKVKNNKEIIYNSQLFSFQPYALSFELKQYLISETHPPY